jgi:predicted nucleic-acid-binding Zn-ribbon protein
MEEQKKCPKCSTLMRPTEYLCALPGYLDPIHDYQEKGVSTKKIVRPFECSKCRYIELYAG